MTNLSVASTRLTQIIRLSVEDAELRPIPYNRTGAMYRPDALVLRFARADDGGWVAEPPEVFGKKLKKDGSDSANRVTERFWRTDGWPQWVTEAVEQYRPALAPA